MSASGMCITFSVAIGSALAMFELLVSVTSLLLPYSGLFGMLTYWNVIVMSEGDAIATFIIFGM